MFRKEFFKKCGQYFVGAAAAGASLLTVSNISHGQTKILNVKKISGITDEIRTLEVQDGCHASNVYSFDESDKVYKEIDGLLNYEIKGDTIYITGMPKNKIIVVNFDEKIIG